MGRKTHGPYLIAAIEANDIQKVSDILSTKFRDKSKVKGFLASDVRRLASEYSEVPLLLAASLEDPTIIKYMVQKHEANINYVHEYGFHKLKKRKSALLVAVKSGLYATVDAIISLNADVNMQDHKGRTPLHHAIKRADYRMVKLLLSRGAQVMLNDVSGNSPLHVATIYGHSELIKLLIKFNGDLYKKGQFGAIPIHIAARQGHSSIVKMFYETYEVNPDIKVPCYDELEKSPLHVAASQGNAETIYTLLTSCAADVNLKDSEGNTALHHTVLNDYDPLGMKSKEDYAETVKVLLNAGALVNLQNGRGETALHLAARSEFQKVIEILLLAGCDPLIEDNDKSRALDLVADDDAVSKQTIKNAIANRDKLMFNSAEVRSQGFHTNFNRGVLANASNRSNSLLNMYGLTNLNASRIMTPNFGSQNYIPPGSANIYLGSQSSSNGKESTMSGSKFLSNKKMDDQMMYHKKRRTKSVEDLDNKIKLKSSNKASKRSARKNSYQESEATSMWSVTPPGSLRDIYHDNSEFKKKNKSKKALKNPETINENQEFEYNNYKNKSRKYKQNYDDATSLGSEDYFLDDESIDGLDDDVRGSSKYRSSKDRVKNWVFDDSHKSSRHRNDYNSNSDSGSLSFESEESSEDDHSKRHRSTEHNFKSKHRYKNKNTPIEQVIELDATGDLDQTTIKVIPIPNRQRVHRNSDSKNKSPEVQRKPNNKMMDTSHKMAQSPTDKPVPKKRTNKEKEQINQDLVTNTTRQNPVIPAQAQPVAKKVDKPTVPKKTNNLIFTKASDQSLDNLEHSNLARISAGDFAIPAKPTYSSIISPSLSNSFMDNSSKSLQQIHNKLQTSDIMNDNSMSKSFELTNTKSFQSHLSQAAELGESDKELSFEKNNIPSPQRIVSYSSSGGLPFTLVGGNDVGIFVGIVDQNSSAFKNGLSSGDRILKINERHVIGSTKEEVDNILRENLASTTLVVLEDVKTYMTLDPNLGGDSVYVKSHFKCEAKRKGDLTVNPGDVFQVIDTLPHGSPGLWRAKHINSKQLDEGLIPNQQRAEQQVTKERLLSNDQQSPEKSRTFFHRSKSTDRINKDNVSMTNDEIENTNLYPVYERVIAKRSKHRRPVVVLGLFCDVVINKLVKENPVMFEKPDEPVESNKNSENPVNVKCIEKSFENGKHSLIILSPTSVEYMLKKTNLNPIVIYLSPMSKAIVKSVKFKLAPNYMKDPGYMYEEAMKFEKNFAELFTTVVGYTADEWWYHNLKEAINNAQSKPIWQSIDRKEIININNKKALEYFPDERNIVRASRDQKPNQRNRISHTTDDIPEVRDESNKKEERKNKSATLKPEVKQKPKVQIKKFVNYKTPTHETPL